MRVILFLIGLILSAYGLYCGAVFVMGIGEAAIVAFGIIFILWGVFYDAFREKKFLRFLKKLFMAFMVILVIYSGVICAFGSLDNASYNEDCVIVLGAGLRGRELSETLKMRLDKTVEYMNKNKSANAVVSGGRGRGESVTEASAMSDYLIANGIDSGRIILDENAASTYENFYYSKYASGDGNVVFITSNFHVLRSMQMAKLNGIEASHMGASTPLITLPAACVREFFAQIAAIRYI